MPLEPAAEPLPGRQVTRLWKDGPLLLAFNDHRQHAIRVNNTDVKLPPKCAPRGDRTRAVCSSDDGCRRNEQRRVIATVPNCMDISVNLAF